MRYRLVFTGIVLISGALAAQPLAPPQTPGMQGQEALPIPVVRMYAVHARGAVPEKLDIEDSLDAIAPLLRELPYTTYSAIAIHEKETPWGEETLFPINAIYSMHVAPVGMDEEGTISVQSYIDMLQEDGTYVKALDAVATAAQNKALLFRGMPFGGDELIVALLVALPSESDTGQEQEPAQEVSEEEEEAQPEPGDEEEEEDAQEDEETEAATEEALEAEDLSEEEQSPEGLEGLEALLESLEEVDRREQIEERNRRDRIDFKGEWW